MTGSSSGVPEDPRAVVIALHELIEALDRRIPHVTRVGERQIREQAAELRRQAVARIQELAAADAGAKVLAAALSNAVMTDDGGPIPAGTREQETVDGRR